MDDPAASRIDANPSESQRLGRILEFSPSDTVESPSPFVAWVLLLAGLGTLAPTVLLPIWDDLQTLRFVEDLERAETESFRKTLESKKRHMDALRSDPAVVARVARRESYIRGPEDTVFVGQAYSARRGATPEIPTRQSITSLEWLLEWIPAPIKSEAMTVFGIHRFRPMLIGLSVVSMSVGLFLFPVRKPRRTTCRLARPRSDSDAADQLRSAALDN
jgi:hypothetical protein